MLKTLLTLPLLISSHTSAFLIAMVGIGLATGSRRMYLSIILATLAIVVGVFMFPADLAVRPSEIYYYYVPKMSGEYLWAGDISEMPLWFYVAKCVAWFEPNSKENVVILTRMIFLTVTVGAMMASTQRLIPHSPAGVYASIFLLLDFTFSFLILGDQFKQLAGQPFFIIFLYAIIEQKKITAVLMAVLASLSHALYIPLTLTSLAILLVSRYKGIKNAQIVIAAVIVGFIPLFALTVQYLMSDFAYWGDKTSHPVPTGLINGLIYAPGAAIQLIYYIVVIIFCRRLTRDKATANLFNFSFLYLVAIIALSKINILGISMAEPARFHSFASPIVAIVMGATFMKSRGIDKFLLGLASAAIFLFLHATSEEKNLYKVLSSSTEEIWRMSLNQSFMVVAAIVIIFTLIFIQAYNTTPAKRRQ